MAGSSVLTLRLDPKTQKATRPSLKSNESQPLFVAAEAIREYVALNNWQIEEITTAVAEADRGDFASDKDVGRVLKKWSRGAR